MKFVDIHTHASLDSKVIQIKDVSQESLRNLNKENFYSLGIHPWFVQSDSLEEDMHKIEDLITQKSLLAIGECGLDKVCATDFSMQRDAFKRQIILSEKYRKPLILHIVGAFNELIQLRQESKAKQVWIVHGFNGSPQLAKQLTSLGMFLSFGFRLINSTSKASKSIGSIPLQNIFLETDTSNLIIEEIYTISADRLNMSVTQLQSQLWTNFQSVFR